MKDVKLFLSDLFPAIGEVVDEALLLICHIYEFLPSFFGFVRFPPWHRESRLTS